MRSMFGNFWSDNKLTFIILLLIAVFSLSLGIFTSIRNASLLGINDMLNDNMCKVILRTRGVMTYFFICLLVNAVVLLIMLILSKIKLFNIFMYALVFAKMYMFGFDLVIIFMAYTVRGVVFLVVLYVPFFLIFNVLFVLILIAIEGCKKLKSICITDYRLSNLHALMWFCITAFIVVLLVQSLLLNFTYVIIIV